MQQPNQMDQTDEILAALKEHEEAVVELRRVKRFTQSGTEYGRVGPEPTPQKSPNQHEGMILVDSRPEVVIGHVWPEMDAIKARLANLPPPADRDAAIAACVAELQALAAEFQTLSNEKVVLVETEMNAAIALESAKIRQRYARRWPILELSTKDLPVQQAEAAYEKAVYRAKHPGNRQGYIRDYVVEHYGPGVDLARAETFKIGAIRRVDAVWGERYTRSEADQVVKELGIPDDLLSRIARLVNPA